MKVTRSQLNAVLAISRFISKCPNEEAELDLNHFFLITLLKLELCKEFGDEVGEIFGGILISAIMASYFPPILQEDAEKLVGYLLEQIVAVNPNSPRQMMHSRGIVVNGGSIMSITLKQQVALFEEESIESLEKNVIALRLLGINTKLSVYKAAAWLQIKCLASLTKILIHPRNFLFILTWRMLRICEDLFSSLLSGISQVTVSCGSQLLRVLLIRLKPLVLTTCALADTANNNQGAMFESVTKTVREIIEFAEKDRAAVETFIMGLAACIRERNDYEEQEGEEKQHVSVKQLNVIRLLATINVTVNKSEVVDMILPLFIDILEEDDTSAPSLLRLQILDATVVLMTKSYLNKLDYYSSSPGFLLIAGGIKNPKLRLDYRHRLLSLCSDVGGADFFGTLLPAVAEICSDFDPTADIEPSLLKLFRNLWFYISTSTTLNSVGSMSTTVLQAVVGAYTFNPQWCIAVQLIAQGTPPLKAAVTQRAALSAALGGRSRQIYLLAVALLEITRFSSNGGILNGDNNVTAARSAFSCVFEYLKTPNLMPVVFQCLSAIERVSETGNEAEIKGGYPLLTLVFIKSMSQREEHLRDTSVLWNSSCLDSLLFPVNSNLPSTLVNDPASVATVRSLYHKVVREWITSSLSYAPCTSQEIRICTGKNDGWIGIRAANVPAVMAAAAAVSGGANLRFTGALSFEVPSIGLNEMLFKMSVVQLQEFVNIAERGEAVDKSLFRETSNLQGFSQLIRLLCWCPAYISTPDAMETGIFIWTWLVSAAPQLGSLSLQSLLMLGSGNVACKDPVEEIIAHRLWLGFFIDRFEVVRHDSIEQLLLLGRMLQGTIKFPSQFSQHPAATGTFFTLMLLGLKLCSCQWKGGLQFLEDRIYRAALGWFANEPEWFDMSEKNFALSEAQSVSLFVHYLSNERVDALPSDSSSKGSVRENGSSHGDMDQYHPVWGKMDNYTDGRAKSKQLLLMLCQHEAHRLEVWATPINTKESTSFRPKTAFSVDPRIAFCLVTRFRALHIEEIRSIAEALPFFVTSKAVDENSSHPRVMAYIVRVLESYPPERVTFYISGKVICSDQLKGVIFSHILIWHLQGETCSPENTAFLALLPVVKEHIIESFNPKARDIFEREFDFFDKVTSISGALYPLAKEDWDSITVSSKVPIMITFDVIDRDGDPRDVKPQSCIFKVGDDYIFEAVGLNFLYVFPYGVLPTGPERDFGTVGSPSFEAARDNFIISAAGYAVASLLLQPKDRHNGNLLFDNVGRLVHIDFGFIFEISPELSHEMTQLLDPSGVMKRYLAARRHMDGIINTVLMMLDSGCLAFSRGDPIGNLRKRFHPEMTERELRIL
ncbi:hypothetical protein MKW92_036691 [Papaver armeniacum]|nr:hypothetical protein MKW92_036691 [Papaver armeniacum]